MVENLKEKFRNFSNIKIVLGDFFEHKGQYDLVIEQTFFCALPPIMREKYVVEIHKILKDKGLEIGLDIKVQHEDIFNIMHRI